MLYSMNAPREPSPSAHVDSFLRERLPPRALWPEMDYTVLPELAAYPPRLNAASALLDGKTAEAALGRGG